MKQKKLFVALAIAAALQSVSTAAFAFPATYTVDQARNIGSKIEYPYQDGSLYEVYAQVEHATEIVLHSGEQLNSVIAGDTARWMIETSKIGNTMHVYIKPKVSGISTNFVINTSRRAYRLQLISDAGTYNPIVSWRYPEDTSPSLAPTREEKEFDEIFTEQRNGHKVVKVLNYSYDLKGSDGAEESLFPSKVFDDGVRTYIKMPKTNKYDLPVLYRVNDKDKNKLTLVNYRVRYGYFIADRVFDHCRLQYSSKEYVDILPVKLDSNAPILHVGGENQID